LGFEKIYQKLLKDCYTFNTTHASKDRFKWDEKFVKVFKLLKSAFTIAPILIHDTHPNHFFLEINAPDFIFHVMLFLYGSDEQLHHVGLHSRKFSMVELKYKIHDNFFLMIINAFTKWQHLFEGAQQIVIIYTNHKNLALK